MTEQEKWDALTHNQAQADEQFLYGVRITGIYCRPSCRTRISSRNQVIYFDTALQAEAAGYRPCKACHPDLEGVTPERAVVDDIMSALDQEQAWRKPLSETAKGLGLSVQQMARIFRKETGLAPIAYIDARRMKAAKVRLWQTTDSLADIAVSMGHESLSAFHTFFSAHAGMTPAEFRRGNGQVRFSSSSITGFGLMDTTIGRLVVTDNGQAITSVRFADIMPDELMHRLGRGQKPLIEKAEEEIAEYLSGVRQIFTVSCEPEGTVFQQAVWQVLRQIPYGETRTYVEVAEQVGNASASRAVGAANNHNPILLLIPCHRVVGANGALVGYAGGVDVKEKLLRLEREHFAGREGL